MGAKHKHPETTYQNRRHVVPGCNLCDKMIAEEKHFHPSHDASPRCESGGNEHCSCDTCF